MFRGNQTFLETASVNQLRQERKGQTAKLMGWAAVSSAGLSAMVLESKGIIPSTSLSELAAIGTAVVGGVKATYHGIRHNQVDSEIAERQSIN